MKFISRLLHPPCICSSSLDTQSNCSVFAYGLSLQIVSPEAPRDSAEAQHPPIPRGALKDREEQLPPSGERLTSGLKPAAGRKRQLKSEIQAVEHEIHLIMQEQLAGSPWLSGYGPTALGCEIPLLPRAGRGTRAWLLHHSVVKGGATTPALLFFFLRGCFFLSSPILCIFLTFSFLHLPPLLLLIFLQVQEQPRTASSAFAASIPVLCPPNE